MNPISELFNRIQEKNLWKKHISLARNDMLFSAGDINTNLYYISEGSLKIYILDESDEQIIRFGYQNNFFTPLDSFISEKPTQFYAQALKKTELKCISKIDYLNFVQQQPDNKALWDRILEQLILQQLERERDILTASPKSRYERVLKRSPQLFQEIPHKYIASYLRMTPETLSRLKKS